MYLKDINNMDFDMRKIDLITGFLGSGKTTFLIKYARHLMKQGLRIGILEYDYGAINVDMLLLNKLRGANCEIEMVAAACDEDCLRRRFITKLIAMAMSGYDRVIVEPSGVFDMDMFFDALRDDPLENMYEIGNVFTIVNAKLMNNLSEEEDFILASQAVSAGTIILSRTQLATDEEISHTKEHLRIASGNIKCRNFRENYLEKNWDTLTDEDFTTLMNSGYHIGEYMKVTAGQDMSFSSKCYLDLPDNLASLKEKINLLFSSKEYGNIIRIKGFVCDEGGGYQVNASQYELLAEPTSIGQGALIVIGTNLNDSLIDKIIKGD